MTETTTTTLINGWTLRYEGNSTWLDRPEGHGMPIIPDVADMVRALAARIQALQNGNNALQNALSYEIDTTRYLAARIATLETALKAVEFPIAAHTVRGYTVRGYTVFECALCAKTKFEGHDLNCDVGNALTPPQEGK